MKILGVGLSRTGTTSLTEALKLLGYKAIHWYPERLADVVNGLNLNPDFRRYDDVDAVTDIPAAYYWRELWKAYPDLQFIFTDRDIDSWWKSVKRHYETAIIDKALQYIVYGGELHEVSYKKKFIDHKMSLIANIPKNKLLILNIERGDGWKQLCSFLSKKVPSVPFPHLNAGNK